MITRLAGLKLAGLFFVHALHPREDGIGDRLRDSELFQRRMIRVLNADGWGRCRFLRGSFDLVETMIYLLDRRKQRGMLGSLGFAFEKLGDLFGEFLGIGRRGHQDNYELQNYQLRIVRKEIDVIHYTDDRRVDSSSGFAG